MSLISVEHIFKRFSVGEGRYLHAVNDVSFTINEGESLGLVGESGSGKSTIARLVTRLVSLDQGKIIFDERDIGEITPPKFARDSARREIQLVFQNADDTLNPAYSAARNIAIDGKDLNRVSAVAADVELAPELLSRRPHKLSGGQQARVGIARALISEPRLLVLDEPTAALDVSVQATVLRLIDRLRQERQLAMLFVSHDLDVVRLMCNRVMVLYLGRVAEYGPVSQIMNRPAHPYTQALLSSAPGRVQETPLSGEPLSPIDPPENACLFHSRCPMATEECRSSRPVIRPIETDWFVACHRAEEFLANSRQ